jgi:Tfp pilus assembly protein PilO
MKKEIHRTSWYVTVPVAAAAVLYVVLFFLPGRRAIAELEQQVDTKQDYVAQSETLAAALVATEMELKKTRQYNQSWRQAAPSPGQLSTLYGKIYLLAKHAGVTTTRFDPEPVVALDALRKIPVAIACTGTFVQVSEFLRALESQPEALWIELLRIQRKEGDEENVDCEIGLVVFSGNPDISN